MYKTHQGRPHTDAQEKYIYNLLDDANATMLDKSQRIREKGIPNLSFYDARLLINILKKYKYANA